MLSAPLAALALRDDLQHVLRREELALLDVDRLAGARDRLDEIGLPAQERGRLQHVDDRRHFRAPRRSSCTSVSTGTPTWRLHFGEDAQALRPCPGRETTRASCGSPCRRTT